MREHNPEMAQLFTSLVFKHIDRMNDVCDEDTAQEIIESFVKGFYEIWEDFTRN